LSIFVLLKGNSEKGRKRSLAHLPRREVITNTNYGGKNMGNVDTAKILLLVAGILFILAFVGGLVGGLLSLPGLLALLPYMTDPWIGPWVASIMMPTLIWMVVLIVFGFFSLILGILCLRWRNNLPGGNTLLIWGIIGIIVGFGIGVLVLVAHFLAGGDV
jgi:hypothetical protein